MASRLAKAQPQILACSGQKVLTFPPGAGLFLLPNLRGISMNRSAILAAASVIASTAGGSAMSAQPPAAAFIGAKVNPVVRHSKGATVLYNQNSNGNGLYINSQNYTSGTYTAYNDQGADDFIVPKGKKWTVTEIDVTGCCSNSPKSENVFFYKDNNGVPGKPVKGGSLTGLQGTGNPSFSITLGKKGVKLKAGHYWVSVVANCSDTGGCADWGWALTTTIHNDSAVWEQPGNGADTGCTTWGVVTDCFNGAYYGDFMFELQGKSKGK
jgi:hypothetical protein